MAVFGFVQFQVCLKSLNFEPEFGNPRLETPKRLIFFQFSVHFFLSICWFYYLVLYKPQQRNLEFWTYFSVISFLCSAAKDSFQTQLFIPSFSNPAFQTQLFETHVLTQPDFENPKKIHFKPEKGHFLFTLKVPVSIDSYSLRIFWSLRWISQIPNTNTKY